MFRCLGSASARFSMNFVLFAVQPVRCRAPLCPSDPLSRHDRPMARDVIDPTCCTEQLPVTMRRDALLVGGAADRMQTTYPLFAFVICPHALPFTVS